MTRVDEIRQRLLERNVPRDHTNDLCPVPSDGHAAFSVPHAWGAGRDKHECVDCDQPRQTFPNRVKFHSEAPVDIEYLLAEVDRLGHENEVLRNAVKDTVS
jgi:hypothetical protein